MKERGVRLGDRLSDEALERRKPRFLAADNLAKRIFDPQISGKELEDYYVNSPRREDREVSDTQDDIFLGLGEYEAMLCGKLLVQERPVLCIVGSIGSGKTTTIRYLVDRIRAQPCAEECLAEVCGAEKLIRIIDFNSDLFNTNDETKAKEVLRQHLTDVMLTELKLRGIPSREEELGDYWNEQIEALKTSDVRSTAFVEIVKRLPQESLRHMDPPLDDEELGTRQKVLDEIQGDSYAYLDYLIRLWGFVTRTYYADNKGCVFIVFDNVDRATPVVQSTLVSLLVSSAMDPGPPFVLLLRPETFARLDLRGTSIIDLEKHSGPTTSSVVLDRLERLVLDPDQYFNPLDGLTRSEFDLVVSFLRRVYESTLEDGGERSTYSRFLRSACGKSHRLALLTAQKLLMASEDEMRQGKVDRYGLVRLAVRQGQDQYRGSDRQPIANLFDVGDAEGDTLLLKPRILKLLAAARKSRSKSVSRIRRTLMAFGYSEIAQVRPALNEMLNIYCQLARSNGFDRFSEREFLIAGSQMITLTTIGQGYLSNLITSIDYVQEVMLDTWVSPERLRLAYGYNYLSDKLLLLSAFLDELRRTDRRETDLFVENLGKRRYFGIFGKYLVSLEIILALARSMNAIVGSVTKHGDLGSYGEVLDELRELLMRSAQDNHEVLGVWPREVDAFSFGRSRPREG
jgi:hypothetical protein